MSVNDFAPALALIVSGAVEAYFQLKLGIACMGIILMLSFILAMQVNRENKDGY